MARPTRGIGDKWIDVCRLLNRRGAAYIVVGGIAVNLHGHVRATRDLDILVPRDIENTRRILEALAELPYGMARELDAETVDARPITIIGDDPRVVAERGCFSVHGHRFVALRQVAQCLGDLARMRGVVTQGVGQRRSRIGGGQLLVEYRVGLVVGGVSAVVACERRMVLPSPARSVPLSPHLGCLPVSDLRPVDITMKPVATSLKFS